MLTYFKSFTLDSLVFCSVAMLTYFKSFTLDSPVFCSVAMLMSSKNVLWIYQSFTLLLCFSLWAKHRWPFLGLFTKDIFCDILTGWGCSSDWYPGDLYTTLCTSTMHLILLDIKMGYCAVSCINGTRFTIYARLFQCVLYTHTPLSHCMHTGKHKPFKLINIRISCLHVKCFAFLKGKRANNLHVFL